MSIEKSELKVAVIEDDTFVQSSLTLLLKGHAMWSFTDAKHFIEATESAPLSKTPFDLILMDLRSENDPEGEFSVAALVEVRRRYPRAELFVQSGVSEVDVMRACIRNGASRFVLKEQLAEVIPATLERLAVLRNLRQNLDRQVLGISPVMEELKRELLNLRFENIDVLIEGETGSGKEMCARALHSSGPWVAVNVAAVPPELFEAEFFGAERGAYTGAAQLRIGYFESAGNGLLFLDEIQSLAPAHQAKLLRVLETRTFTRVGSSQERPLRARIVSASNRSLREAVAKGAFREDLYYRLAPITVQVPPLRVRASDIPLLAESFLFEFDPMHSKSFTPAALDFLESAYDWPGNVRELRGLVRNLVIRSKIPRIDEPEAREGIFGVDGFDSPRGPQLQSTGQPFAPDWNQGFDANVERFERYFMAETLARHPSSSEAREKLGMARSRFYEKLKQYGLKS